MPNFAPIVYQEIEALARALQLKFAQTELYKGCEVKDVSDKDQYATGNGWIEAVVAEHNQQRVRYLGDPPGIGTSDFVDVIYFPNRRLFEVYGQGGTIALKSPVLNNYAGTADPTVNDDSGDGYSIGSTWVNTTDDTAWLLLDDTAGSANWDQINGAASSGRELLTTTRTYFVDGSAGSDSNDGLTSGTAFATIQKAVDVASSLDNGGFNITIDIADDTYAETVSFKTFIGSGLIILDGNTSTPSLVNVQGAGGSGAVIFSAISVLGTYRIQGILLSGGTNGIFCQNSSVQFQLCEFGTVTGSHIVVLDGGLVQAVGNYFVVGAATRHWFATNFGVIRVQNRTVTFVLGGATNFSVAFCASSQGRAQVEGCTFTIALGSVTGTRYSATENGVIFTNGGGATYFPGNAAGSTATGGQYI